MLAFRDCETFAIWNMLSNWLILTIPLINICSIPNDGGSSIFRTVIVFVVVVGVIADILS